MPSNHVTKATRKPATAIARDALALAQRKRAEGCTSCAAAYARLAAEHGATTDDLSRADLLQILGVGAAGLAVSLLAPGLATPAAASASGGLLNGQARAQVLDAALTDGEVQALLPSLIARGFVRGPDVALATATGTVAAFLALGTPTLTQTAIVMWGRTTTGAIRASGVVITVPPRAQWPAESTPRGALLAWAERHVGIASVTESGTQPLAQPRDPNSCITCVTGCTVGSCGWAALACLASGPGVLVCLEAVCGEAAFNCLVGCMFAQQCP